MNQRSENIIERLLIYFLLIWGGSGLWLVTYGEEIPKWGYVLAIIWILGWGYIFRKKLL